MGQRMLKTRPQKDKQQQQQQKIKFKSEFFIVIETTEPRCNSIKEPPGIKRNKHAINKMWLKFTNVKDKYNLYSLFQSRFHSQSFFLYILQNKVMTIDAVKVKLQVSIFIFELVCVCVFPFLNNSPPTVQIPLIFLDSVLW